MPIYEYTCLECEHEFEYFIISSNQDGPVCPKCHDRNVKKQMSGSNFKLKGGGWGVDGYHNPNKK